jgi:hypothetical protein
MNIQRFGGTTYLRTCWIAVHLFSYFISVSTLSICALESDIEERMVRGSYNILVGRPAGIRPLGRPRRRWEDNIKMDLREIGFGDVDWIHLAQDGDRWRALMNTVMNLRVS